jgi:hypothetical protein
VLCTNLVRTGASAFAGGWVNALYISSVRSRDFLARRPTGRFDAEVSGSYGSFKSSQARGTVDFGDLYGLMQMFSYEHGESDGWSANTADRNNNFYYSADYSRGSGDRLSVYAIYKAYTDADFNSNSFVRAVPGAPRSVVGTVSLRF